MKRFALIGHPVAGSLSPRLFSAAYDGRYPYDLVDDPSFEVCWERFLSHYDGINVTAPFKMDAFREVDVRSETALLSGAVNLVVRENGLLRGYNTDVDGVVRSVRECGIPVSRALVVGAGGAGRAAVTAARILGCEVIVANRTFAKAETLAKATGALAIPLPEIASAGADLVLYTLPAALPEMPDWHDAVVLEANYKTPCLPGRPCRLYLSGHRWLLHQAVAGYALFTGEEPDTEKMAEMITLSL